MDISATIATFIDNVTTIRDFQKDISTVDGLPKTFGEVVTHLPLVGQKLEIAQPKLEAMTVAQYRPISTIVNDCSEDVSKMKGIFQALHETCGREPGSKNWTTVRPFYIKAIDRRKELRIECLMSGILENVKRLCQHKGVRLPIVDVEAAFKHLTEAGVSLEDSDFDQKASICADQTNHTGAFGQQNNVVGGENKFSSGYTVAGGTLNQGYSPSHTGKQ